jgi:hypothetical protein
MSDKNMLTFESLKAKKLSKDWDSWVCPVNKSTWVFHRKYPHDLIKHVLKCKECSEKMIALDRELNGCHQI